MSLNRINPGEWEVEVPIIRALYGFFFIYPFQS